MSDSKPGTLKPGHQYFLPDGPGAAGGLHEDDETRPLVGGAEGNGSPPLIFLDMDDVLCLNDKFGSREMLRIIQWQSPDRPELWTGLVDPDAAANLYELYTDFTPAFIISSSWATYLDQEQMRQVLTRTKLQFVVENLHPEWRTPRARSSSRRDEITWWLDAHRVEGQAFLVIDDSYSGTGLAHSPLALDGHVVLCRSGYGFTKKRLKEAKFQLERQLGWRLNQVTAKVPVRASTCPEDDPDMRGSTAAPQRRKLSLSSLTSTEPRNADEVRRANAQGRIAELKPDQA